YRDSVDFEALGFDLQRRAEDVPVDEYVRVAQVAAASNSGESDTQA
ncbi:MAG TPA: 16S rRNA (adenine(1518)-N(6)/adenine(1519)-N(6))-dimethyltransferase, partial [Paraburkholderia sp.]|nr:16S rRNA (adenine(1518)-N(6)/adenine(1519)-N(6))-dimethyltransferase [Paraburkholderia sp.]